MSALHLLGALIALSLFLYLGFALLYPEKLS